MRLANMLARPVLPEPGIPLTAIINRDVSGVVRSFARGKKQLALVCPIEVKVCQDQNLPQDFSSSLSSCCSIVKTVFDA